MKSLAELNGLKSLNKKQQHSISGGSLRNPAGNDPQDLPRHTDDDYKTKE
ncbi:hypothetical protein GCM10022393_24710 [Aquimarina addita]|uniref:Uncharacterized protein n=1 Tax=Aquimarina addita TaxID=870485 RepID=A0ABP6UKG3_9FLAO